MLDYFRKRSQSKLVALLFGLIALTFIFGFGVLPNVGSGTPGNPANVVVSVGDRAVLSGEVERRADQLAERIGGELEPQMLDYLKSQALQGLLQRQLLALAARDEGIRITDQEVVDAIQESPAFRREGGEFNPELYHQQLRYLRLKPADYEADVRADLEIERLQGLILAGVGVSDAEVEERYRLENERMSVKIVAFDPTSFENRVEAPDEATLEAYHAAHPERFEAPAKVTVSLAVIDPAAFQDDIEVSEADLLDRYDADPDRWDVGESVEARHILIRSPREAEESEDAIARGRAESILFEIDQGADFETLARERSEDPGSAATGGALGRFERGQMVPEFEQAAFGAEVGEVVGPVRTPYGWHLIQVTAHQREHTRSFEEVKDELTEEIRTERATEAAEQRARELASSITEEGGLEAAATEMGFTAERAGPVTESEPIQGSMRLTTAAFDLVPGEPSEPIRTVRGFELLWLLERTEPQPLSFEEARADVEVAVRRERAEELARSKADEARTRLADGADPATVATELGGELDDTGPFPLTSRVLPKLGADEALVDAAFALTESQPVSPEVLESRDRLVVLVLGEREQPPQDDPARIDTVRQRLLQERRQGALNAFLTELQERYEPEFNEEALSYLFGDA